MSIDCEHSEHRDGAWVLTMTRELPHPPRSVWPWLTDPQRLAAGPRRSGRRVDVARAAAGQGASRATTRSTAR